MQKKNLYSRPRVVCMMAQSADGFVARHPLETNAQRWDYGLGNQGDRSHLLGALGGSQAVFMGLRTLCNEKGAIRLDHNPLWVIFCGRSFRQVPLDHKVFQQKGFPKILFHCTDFNTERSTGGLKIFSLTPLVTGMEGSLGELFVYLYGQGVSTVSLLGGGELNGLLNRSRCIDSLLVTLFPNCFIKSGIPLFSNSQDGKHKRNMTTCFFPSQWALKSYHFHGTECIFLYYQNCAALFS